MIVKGRGKLVREPYQGNGKSGTYFSGYLETDDKYPFWVGFYAAGDTAKAFQGAKVGQVFEVEGYLSENQFERNGVKERKIQIKLTKAAPVSPIGNIHGVEIDDQDIPF